MARQNTRGLELSFHRGSKQWRKRVTIEGKPRDMYFGKGRGVSDRASYKRALGAYHKWRAEHDQKKAAKTAFQRALEHLVEFTGEPVRFKPDPSLNSIPAALTRQEKVDAILANPIFAALLDEHEDAAAPPETPLDRLFSEYQDHIDHRLAITQASPDTVATRERLGGSMHRTLIGSAKRLREHFDNISFEKLDDCQP